MKKILSVLFIQVLLVLIPFYSYATPYMGEATSGEGQQADMEVTYTVDGTYTISIPESIVAGNSFSIRATEMNIADGKQVDVTVDNIQSNGSIQITNTSDNTSTLDVYFYDENHNSIANHLASFTNESQGQEKTFTSEVSLGGESKAGTYSGVLMFSIFCN